MEVDKKMLGNGAKHRAIYAYGVVTLDKRLDTDITSNWLLFGNMRPSALTPQVSFFLMRRYMFITLPTLRWLRYFRHQLQRVGNNQMFRKTFGGESFSNADANQRNFYKI